MTMTYTVTRTVRLRVKFDLEALDVEDVGEIIAENLERESLPKMGEEIEETVRIVAVRPRRKP